MPEINECQPISIYPLGVTCQVTNPSGPNKSDGTATLTITGGTPPYNITWENGNSSYVITNLSAGSYPATVVDYYGDYTANTTCVLVDPVVPTTTTTTTIPPLPTYDFCMVINIFYDTTFNLTNHFNPNGDVNGKPSWISDDELYTIVWDNIDNRWELVDTVYNLTVINNSPSYPPLSNWLLLGAQGTVTVYEDECVNVENLSLNVTKNDPSCTSCDASITIEGSGGVPPYQYSINGGTTWVTNPLFQDLCPDVVYSPQIKDSVDTIIVSQSGNITFTSKPIKTYNISLDPTTTLQLSTTSYEYNYKITITPPLPDDGTTITFDINFMESSIKTPYLTSANFTVTSEIKKNNNIIPSIDTDVDSSTPNLRPGCTGYMDYKTIYNRDYKTLSIKFGDVYSVKLIREVELTCNSVPSELNIPNNEIQTPEPTPIPTYDDNTIVVDDYLGPLKYGVTVTGVNYVACCIGYFQMNNTYKLNNPKISGCECCRVQGITTNNFGWY